VASLLEKTWKSLGEWPGDEILLGLSLALHVEENICEI
jgi:hypothetical protein